MPVEQLVATPTRMSHSLLKKLRRVIDTHHKTILHRNMTREELVLPKDLAASGVKSRERLTFSLSTQIGNTGEFIILETKMIVNKIPEPHFSLGTIDDVVGTTIISRRVTPNADGEDKVSSTAVIELNNKGKIVGLSCDEPRTAKEIMTYLRRNLKAQKLAKDRQRSRKLIS